MKKDLNILIKKQQKEFDIYYKQLLKSILPKNKLSKVMFYGAFSKAKRIRPFLTEIFAKLAKIEKKNYLRISSAIESIHSYSLIHDDLPSMDDDDYRRGKLSVHKKFNEAQAILAGDSLHDVAFELLSDTKTHHDSRIRVELIRKLSINIGAKGLAGGQSLDLIYENKNTNKKNILNMYKMKTSSLFSFCCEAPFIMSRKNNKQMQFAKEYGILFGLIFQIVDDYLDVVEKFNKIGKTPKKDIKQGKSTILKFIDKKDIILYCENLSENFISKNKNFFFKWPILKDLLYYIIYRRS